MHNKIKVDFKTLKPDNLDLISLRTDICSKLCKQANKLKISV